MYRGFSTVKYVNDIFQILLSKISTEWSSNMLKCYCIVFFVFHVISKIITNALNSNSNYQY